MSKPRFDKQVLWAWFILCCAFYIAFVLALITNQVIGAFTFLGFFVVSGSFLTFWLWKNESMEK